MTSGWRHLVDVVAVLVRRDFLGKYQNTAVGLLWSLISPCLYLAVFYVVFTQVFRIGIERYASFVFVGILTWTWFQGSVVQGVSAITGNANLVAQPGFPTGALPVVAVAGNLINLVIAVPVFVAVLLLEGGRVTPAILLLPLLLGIQFLLNLGCCYFLAALNVSLRDVQYIVPVLLQLGYYVSPIFYDARHVPAAMAPYLVLNPMFALIQAYRSVLWAGVAPDPAALFITACIALGVLAAGGAYFRYARHRFLEAL